MRLSLLAALVVATGCQTYAQHRAALVPHAAPLTTDGQPLESLGEIALGASNLHDWAKPTAGNPDAGIAIPSTQGRGTLDFRASRYLAIGAVYERGFAAGSNPVSSSEPAIKNDDASGFGFHMTLSIPTGTPGLRVALATEIMSWQVPWVQYTTCIQNCNVPGFTTSDTGYDSVTTLAVGLIPSYRSGPLTVFGGVTVRNHPTITEKVESIVADDPTVQAGPVNVTLHAGAELEAGAGVRLGLIADQTVTRDPVVYGPSLAAMITIPFGSVPTVSQAPVNVPWGAAPAR